MDAATLIQKSLHSRMRRSASDTSFTSRGKSRKARKGADSNEDRGRKGLKKTGRDSFSKVAKNLKVKSKVKKL